MIARRVGAAVGRLNVSKQFESRCEDDNLSWSRRQYRIDREAEFDGLWVVRTSLDADCIGPDEMAVHSLHTLLADLSTVVLNDVSIGESESFKLAAAPTPGQKRAFDLLGVNPRKMFPQAGR